MHIKFAQYIQAQEIFARWGHCHRPTAHTFLHIYIYGWIYISIFGTALRATSWAARVDFNAVCRASESAIHVKRDGMRDPTRFVRRLDIMYLCKCTARQWFVFFFSLVHFIVWHSCECAQEPELHVHFDCLVLSYRLLCARDRGSQIYIKITDALKELCWNNVHIHEEKKSVQRTEWLSRFFYIFFGCVWLRFHRERERIDNSLTAKCTCKYTWLKRRKKTNQTSNIQPTPYTINNHDTTQTIVDISFAFAQSSSALSIYRFS